MTANSVRCARRGALFVAALLACSAIVLAPPGVASAAGTPDITLERSVDPQTLYGRPAAVTLTASNIASGAVDGYNLSFRDVLPAGATVGAASPSPTRQLLQLDGTTVLIWENVADLLVGVSYSISYEVVYPTGTEPGASSIGGVLAGTAGAYVNSDARLLPRFDATTGAAVSGTYTGWDTDTSQTALVPFLVHKSEPSDESELLRGVHDHQTVYTITIENNLVYPTTGVSIVDYLPAGLEYLGCTTVVDNSTLDTEEYPGSGRILPAHGPLAHSCPGEGTATTVTNPAGVGSGVYTRVEWAGVPDLAAAATYQLDYVAAIPLRQNVAFDGIAIANLDNNTGELTEDEQGLTNHVAATGTTVGNTATVDTTHTVTAEDVSIHKSVTPETIAQGQLSIWTLLIESSEYARSTGPITVTDTIPDGLKFVSSSPVSPDSVVTQADHTQLITWTLPGFVNENGTATITMTTETLAVYRGGGPVSSNDSWTNSVHLATTATIVNSREPDPGNPMAPQVGQYDVVDDSEARQEAEGIALSKEVSAPQTPMSCGSVTSWAPEQAGDFRPGDLVCWRLTLSFPADLDTRNTVVRDLLPAGFNFVDSVFTTGPNGNTVVAGDVAFVQDGSLLTWTLADVSHGARFQVVVTTVIDDPSELTSNPAQVDLVENLLKVRYTNSAGQPFQLRDSANASYVKALLALDKSIVSLNGTPLNPPQSSIPATGGDIVGYRVTVSNIGDLATTSASVRDLLPVGIDCAQVGSISDDGTCMPGAPSYIQWSIGAIPIGGSHALTYTVTFDATEVPGTQYVNHAGVREYTSATNVPGSFTYVPANNIDPTLEPQANTERADDTAEVRIINPSITKGVTSPVLPGNSATQATIGEAASYTVIVTIPEGLHLTGPATLTDVVPSSLGVVAGTPAATLNGTPTSVGVSGNSLTVTLPDPYDTVTGDATLRLTFDAVVLDIAGNQRGTSIDNVATFTYDNAAGQSTSIQANVGITVVNPFISMAKANDDTDGVVSAGQLLTYTLTVTNANTGTTSTAYDTQVVDTLPADMIPLSGNVPAGNGDTVDGGGGVWNATARTITFTIPSILRGASVPLVYRVRMADPLPTGGTIVNTAVARTTSMSGTVAGERTGNSGPGAAGGSGFVANASHTERAEQLSLTKSVTPTTQTIGERVTYAVDVLVPAGIVAYDVTVIDVVPTGIEDVTLVSVTCTAAGGCDPDVNSAAVVSSGQTYAFFLGDLVPADDAARTVRIVYSGRLAKTVAAPQVLTNSATVHANWTDELDGPPDLDDLDFDFSSPPATTNVTVVEPHLTIDKNVDGQVGDTDWRRARPGDVLTYRVAVVNTGTSTAYDVHVTDTPDPRMLDFQSLGSVPAGALVTDSNPADGTLAWTVASIPANGSITISYTLTVPSTLGPDDEIVAGPEIVNTADVPSYLGVPPVGFDPTIHKKYDDVTPDRVQIELDLARLGDRVWYDVNADGVQDAGEPGIAGLTVTVTYLGADGVLGGGDDEVHTTTTGADGMWGVTNLPGGDYVVTVTPPAGYRPTYDLDGIATPHTTVATLAEDQVRTDVDFGYTGTGSIGDTVWYDVNGDGAQNLGEPGLGGVAITVTWHGPTGDIVFTTTTDADGKYVVSDLPPGIYTVAADPDSLPPGFVPTFDLDDPDPSDPESGAGTPHSTAVTLSPGGTVTTADFGYTGTGSIGDFVWLDRNGNGAVDPGEPGIPGATVTLVWYGRDGVRDEEPGGDDVTFTTSTDANGNYLFPNLPAGSFDVAVTGNLPAGVTPSFDEDCTPDDEDCTPDARTAVTLGIGEDGRVGNHLTADFGFHATTLLGDRVWWDLDRDGVQDPGEPGIPGVEITVTYAGPDGDFDTPDDNLTFVVVTDENGEWLLPNVALGRFRTEVTGGVPAGMSLTNREVPRSETELTDDEPIDRDQDFGYAGTGSIGDFVWLDLNGDGVQDVGEPGLPGADVVVTWYGPDGEPGTDDDLVVTVTTDIDGHWSVPGLPAGTYEVRVDPATLLPDLRPTFDRDVPDGGDADGSTVLTLEDDEHLADVDFGYRGGSAIGDTVVWDRDNSGSITDGDVGLVGIDVVLDWAGPDGEFGTPDDEQFTTTTDVNGTYRFDGLPAGNYIVGLDLSTVPDGFEPTFDEDGGDDLATSEVALGPDEEHLSADFGVTGAGQIGERVWLDLNGDGVQDPGEPGVVGQRVDLTWAGADGEFGTDDDIVLTTTTGPDGAYLFDHLPDGRFRVEVVGGIALTDENTGYPEGGGSSQSTLVLAGEIRTNLEQNFGYQGRGAIGDTVWWDVDGDGLQGAGEPPLAGVTVVVTWLGVDGVPSADDLAFTTTTDANGKYLVEWLPAGYYTVDVTAGVPPSLLPNVDADSPAGTGDGRSALTLAPGAVNLDQDFGFTATGRIGDLVWLDVDADGVHDAGEPGIAGAIVTLTFAGLDGVFGTPDDMVFTTATDAAGHYLFERLAAGPYRVAVSGVAADLRPSFDPDGGLDSTSALTLGAGESRLDQDFGFHGTASLSGVVYHDVDRDAGRTPGDPGLGGVMVIVTWHGPDGPITLTTVTAPDGTWSIGNLPSGDYTAVVDLSTVPAGYLPTTPASVAVTVPAGGTAAVEHGLAPAPDPTSPPGPGGGDLPQTGGGGGLAGTAFWLVVVGIFAVFLGRRRLGIHVRVRTH